MKPFVRIQPLFLVWLILAGNLIGAAQADQAEKLYNEGKELEKKGDYRGALSKFQAGLKAAEERRDRKATASHSLSMGIVLLRQGSYREAMPYLQRALTLSEALKDKRGMAETLNYIAIAHRLPGDYDRTLEYHQRALKLNKELGDKSEIAETLNYVGIAYRNKKSYDQAIEYYQKAYKLREELDDKSKMAEVLHNIGSVYSTQESYKKAIEYYQRALSLTEAAGDKAGMAETSLTLGAIYERQALYPKALEYYQKTLKLAEALGNKDGIARALNAIAGVYDVQGLRKETIDYLQRSLKLNEETGNKKGIAQSLHNIASAYLGHGSYDEAIEYLQRALKMQEEQADQSRIASTLYTFAVAYRRQGSYGKAVEYLQRALKLREELGDKWAIAGTLNYLGMVYRSQGLYERAIEYYQKALRIREELDDKRGIAQTLNNIGAVLRSQGSFAQAIEFFQRALKIWEESGNKAELRVTLYNLGVAYEGQKSYDKAIEHLQKALDLSRAMNAKDTMGYALEGIGSVYMKLKDYPRALDALQQAVIIGQEIKEPEITWQAQRALGSAYEESGQPALALKYYQAAIAEVESVRAQASSDESKAGFLQNKTDIYRKACALLLALHEKDPTAGYDRQALAYAESARARALVDLLAEGAAGLNKRLSPELQEKEKELLTRLSRANQKLRRLPPGGEREALIADIKHLEAEHDHLKETIRQQDPTYAGLAYPQPYGLAQIRKELLDGETALLEYQLDEARSFVYFVSRKELVVKPLAGRPRLEEKVTAFLAAVKSPQAQSSEIAAVQAAGQELYQEIVAPVADHLNSYRRLIIAADGLLYYVPFEALGSVRRGAFRYLIEDHVLSYAPSATALGELIHRSRNRTEPVTLLALGNPDLGNKEGPITTTAALRGFYDTEFNLNSLPFTGDEVQQIARYFRRSTIRVQHEASETFLKHAALENYRVIHFATHGLLDEENPQASSIVLSLAGEDAEDGFLQVREIYNLKLNADLIVLSACNTGRGRLVNGEGIMGLHRAFFYAGARAVLGSLWSIKDRATSDFMNQFYYQLQKGDGKAEALREAKLAFLKSPGYRHPYYWAAFVLQGEPKEALPSGRPWLGWLVALLLVLFLAWMASRQFLKKRSA